MLPIKQMITFSQASEVYHTGLSTPPLLLVILNELLTATIWKNRNVSGLRTEHVHNKICLYADDVLLFLLVNCNFQNTPASPVQSWNIRYLGINIFFWLSDQTKLIYIPFIKSIEKTRQLPVLHLCCLYLYQLIVPYHQSRTLYSQDAGFLVIQRISKSRMGGRASAIKLLSCGTILQSWYRRQTYFQILRVGLKPSFLIKNLFRAGPS